MKNEPSVLPRPEPATFVRRWLARGLLAVALVVIGSAGLTNHADARRFLRRHRNGPAIQGPVCPGPALPVATEPSDPSPAKLAAKPAPLVDMTSIHNIKNSSSAFVLPRVLRAEDGIVELTVAMTTSKIGPHDVSLRSYNGNVVGPTLRVRRGETLKVLLTNDLPEQNAKPRDVHKDANYPHDFNVTNLHVHGLHVSPNKGSDDVFARLEPRQKPLLYTFAIPEDHPVGTFWYHAHLHGATGMQVASGMAGALIVASGKNETQHGRGNMDLLRGVKDIPEKILLFQQIPYRIDPATGVGSVNEKDVYFDGTHPPDGASAATLVNGILAPVITVRPGAVERWRMIHGGIQATLRIKLKAAAENSTAAKPTLSEIAVDGLVKHRTPAELKGGGAPKTESDAFLQPGNRSDVLVHFPKGGKVGDVYYLYTGNIRAEDDNRGQAHPEQYLAKIVLEGVPVGRVAQPEVAELEKCQPFAPIDKVAPENERDLTFTIRNGKGLIDKKTFSAADPVGAKYRFELEVPVEWTIDATNAGQHPFHIHTNSFEVLKFFEGEEEAGPFFREWRDTVAVANDDRFDKNVIVKTRMCPKKFTGETVMHCHNLHHEDHGMMLKIAYVKSGQKGAANAEAAAAGGFAALPAKAPAWRIADAAARSHALKDFAGKDIVLVLHLGGD